MLYSMTGFGDAQREEEGFSFLVEIRSLNNRFLKVSVKLPELVAYAEPEINKILRNELSRGSVNYALHIKQTRESAAMDVNQGALKKYMSSLAQVYQLEGSNDWLRVDLASMLLLPGVCQSRSLSEKENAHLLGNIQELTREALGALRAMRAEEGKSLTADLLQQCQTIRTNLQALCSLTDKVLNAYRRRIQDRVNSMLAEANLTLDEEQLMREVAIFAERCDINEEVSRLLSHLDQFESACGNEQAEQVGRRLDFMTQEMLREANTIASKANDAQISQHVVEIKVAIDRLKEQIQNVE